MATATVLSPAGTQVSGTWQEKAKDFNQKIDTGIDAIAPVLKAGLTLTASIAGDALKADPRFASYAAGIDVSTKLVAPIAIEHSVNGSVVVAKPMLHESVNTSFSNHAASLENRASSITISSS